MKVGETIPLPGADGNAHLLVLQFIEGSDCYTVTLTDSATGHSWTAEGARSSQPDDPALAVTPGTYTVFLDPGQSLVQGYGTGSISVRKNGTVRLVGTLAEKTPFSTGGRIDLSGKVPIFVPIYWRAGHLAGEIAFRREAGESTPTVDSDADGILNWFKPAGSRGRLYSEGIHQQLEFRAALYTPPGRGERALSSFNSSNGAGNIQLVGGGLPELVRPLNWSAKNKITIESGEEKVVISVNSRKGIFKGTRTAMGGKPVAFQGVLYQKLGGIAIGSFTGLAETGIVSIFSEE